MGCVRDPERDTHTSTYTDTLKKFHVHKSSLSIRLLPTTSLVGSRPRSCSGNSTVLSSSFDRRRRRRHRRRLVRGFPPRSLRPKRRPSQARKAYSIQSPHQASFDPHHSQHSSARSRLPLRPSHPPSLALPDRPRRKKALRPLSCPRRVRSGVTLKDSKDDEKQPEVGVGVGVEVGVCATSVPASQSCRCRRSIKSIGVHHPLPPPSTVAMTAMLINLLHRAIVSSPIVACRLRPDLTWFRSGGLPPGNVGLPSTDRHESAPRPQEAQDLGPPPSGTGVERGARRRW